MERIIDLLDEQADPTALPSDAVGIGLRRARFALTYGDAEGALRIVQDVLARDDALHPVNQPVVEALEVWLLFVLGRLRECIETGERVLTRLGSPELAGMTLGRDRREPRHRPRNGRQPRPRGGADADRPGPG